MIRIAREKIRLLGVLSLFLVAGFLATSIAAYVVSRDSIRNGITENALPLTADNIYSEIQKDLLRPVFISSLMAQDTFVRDWILGGELDSSRIVRYLGEVKRRYGTVSSFLVSNVSRKYYFPGGTLKSVREGEPSDKWFFRVRDMTAPYETNVDFDLANRNTMTIFINYRVLDYDGNFIGAIGVGLTLDTVGRLIDRYEAQFRRRIYFVDPHGVIVLAGKSMSGMRGSIRDHAGISSIADAILGNGKTPKRLEFARDGAQVLVNSRFIPELGWHLVVEQSENEELKAVTQVFRLNLAVSATVSLIVLVITWFAVSRYQRRLERMATTDTLTGLLNRQAFDFVFQQMIAESKRSGRPFSVILFDLDLFKEINDRFGHLVGDRVISGTAELARTVVRGSDVVARWGGEEFLIMLKDCPLDNAMSLSEKLRQRIADHDFAVDPALGPVTVSLGVAEYLGGESGAGFFARADAALYQAKSGGRNRSVAASTAVPGETA